MIRIAITGPESSGKTTLSKALADHFQVKWFPEHAREYLKKNGPNYSESDLLNIALQQNQERVKEEVRDNILIYDTENLVLKIWSQIKYGHVTPEVISLVKNQYFDHYFLCSPEGVDWEEDPLREHPNNREELFSIYEVELKKLKVPFTVLKGSLTDRLEMAVDLIQDLSMAKGGFCV